MKLKRLISLFLGSTLIISALAGCGNSVQTTGEETGSETAPKTETAQEAPQADEADEEVTITLGIWPEETLTDDIKMHEGFVAAMNELHPNVTCVPSYYKYAPETFMSKVEAGNVETVFESWFTEPQKLIKNNAVADITDYLEERGWLDQINPSIRTLLSDANGRVYGIPRDAYALGMMLNVELFEEAGLVDADGYPLYPTSWEDLAQKAKQIKDATGSAGICLLAKDNAGGWHWSNIAWGFGATLCVDNGDGTYTANLNSKEAIAAMEYTKSLKWEYDVLTADPMSEDWGTGFTAIATGDAAMYIAANEAVAQPTQANGMALESLAMCPVPAGPAGQYSLMGGTPYMFSKDATPAEINAALDYLEIMGKAPVLTDISMEGKRADAQNRVDSGVPVIATFPCWVGTEIADAEAKIVEEYRNVDPKMYDSYFEAASSAGLHPEEPGLTQDMYAELTKVLQAVITDEDADVTALMNTANDNYQALLDAQ